MNRSNLAKWLLSLGGLTLGGAALLASTDRGSKLKDSVRSALVAEMQSLIGTPYLWGGKTPSKGLDCSGAVNYVLSKLGLVSPSFVSSTNAHALYTMSSPLGSGDVKPGDLVFYGTPSRVTHVMMALGDGRVIGATGGDQSTTSTEIAQKQGASVQIKPSATYRGGLVGFGRLPVIA